MKNLFIVTIFYLMTAVLMPVTAVTTSTPSATPTTQTVKDQQIEDLKDRVASKVAELKQSERRAIYGTVKTKTISTLTIDTEKNNVKIELTDEIKIFQMLKGKRTALTIDDVAKDDVVTVFGDYDTAVEVLKAKVIFIQNPSTIVHVTGIIKEVNKTDYTITITGKDDQAYIIDFETITKTMLWAGKDGLIKGGFSKLTPDDVIYVTGTNVPKKENRISAARIVNLGNLTGVLPTPSPTPEATPKPTTKPTVTP